MAARVPNAPYAPKNVVQYGRHLDVALTTNKPEFFTAFPKRFPWAGGDWPAEELVTDPNGFVGDTPIFCLIEDTILSRANVLFANAEKPLEAALSATEESIRIQAKVIYGSLGVDTSCSVDGLSRKLTENQTLLKAWRGKLVVCKIHSEVAHAASRKEGEFSIKTLPGISFRRSLVRLPTQGKTFAIIDYTWLLNVLDKIEARFHAVAYTVLVQDIYPFRGTGFLELTLSLYGHLDGVYSRLGSQACSVFKLLEALATGAVLEAFGDDVSDVGFLQRTLDSLATDKRLIWIEASTIAGRFRDYLKAVGEAGVHAVMEQFGQEKIHWLPVASEEEGMKKMYNYGTEVRETDFEFIREVRGVMFKRLLLNYYTKEGSLIQVEEDLFMDQKIQDIYLSGVCPSLAELNKIPNSSWAELIPMKTFDFNYIPDPLALMDDKSCGVDRGQIAQYYADVVQRELNLTPPGTKQERRLIQWILDQETIDIEVLFQTCAELGGLPFAERVIALLGKEWENKFDLRMYSVLHPHVRLRASTLERNIKDTIFPYMHEQTLSMPGADLLKRIDRFSATMADPEKVVVAIHLDLKAWNHFHYESATYPTQNLLNQLFGVTWWDQMMWPFKQSVFVSSESFNPPGIHGRFNCWEGYNGGNQGICQCLWTFLTQTCIHRTMEDFTAGYELAGLGDNQVILVDVTEVSDRAGFLLVLRAALDRNFRKLGLELKLEDTWHSSTLLAYQRKYYYKGLPLLGGLKQSAKFAAGVTDGVYSIDAHCQTAMGSGMTLAGAVKHPFIGPFLAYMEMLSGILANPDWSKMLGLGTRSLTALTWVGSELGYYSTLQLPAFMFSGNKDPLSDSLALLSKIFAEYPEYRQTIGRLVSLQVGSLDRERILDFVLNPLSPNLKRSPTVEGRLQRMTEDGLMTGGNIKNRTISALFRVSQRAQRVELAHQLCTIRPLNMSLIHSLYESSHIGQAHSSITKVSKLKSLVKLAEKQDPDIRERGLAMATLRIDRQYAREVVRRLETPVLPAATFIEQLTLGFSTQYLSWCQAVEWDPYCTFSARIFLIAHTWGLGHIIPRGPYIPSVIEQVSIRTSITEAEEGHSVVVTPAHDIPCLKETLEARRGPFSLYVGSKTPDPTRTIRLVNLEGLDLAGIVKSLTAMFSWITFKGKDPNIMCALSAEMELRVPGLAEHLEMAGSFIVGGTMEHRFYTRGTDMGAWALGRSVVSTWYRMSTDRATRFQDSDSNRLIFFQGILQHVVATLRVAPIQHSSCYAVVNLDHCSYMVDESDYTCPVPIRKPPPEVASVFRTSPRSLEQVAADLSSKAKVISLGLMTPSTDVEGLSAALASQMAKIVQKYQLGRFGGGTTEVTQGAMRSPINITLVRKVPLLTLLRSLFVALSFHRCLGPSSGYRGCRRRLRVLTSNSTGLQDVEAFRQILDTLLTAGKILELSRIVGYPPSWSVQQLSAKGVLFLLHALEVAADSLGDRSDHVSLVMEVKRPDASFLGLHHFLRSWSPQYRKAHSKSDGLDPLGYLASRDGYAHPLKVFIVPEVDVLVGLSRYLDPSGEEPVQQETLVTLPPPAPLGRSGGVPLPVGLLGDPGMTIPTPVVGKSRANFTGFGMDGEEAIDLTQVVKWAAPSSGARLKFAEILAYLPEGLGDLKLGLCLAEGAGSVCSLLLHLAPDIRIVFNTLVISQSMSKSIGVGYWPPSILCPCQANGRVVNAPYVSKFSGDLRKSGTWQELVDFLRREKAPLDILTWDMEASGDDYSSALQNLVGCIITEMPRICAIKIYMYTGPEVAWFLTEHLQTLGYWVQLIKPNTSNIQNSEVFVLAQRTGYPSPTISRNDISEWAQSLLDLCAERGIRSWAATLRDSAQWALQYTPCAFTPPLLSTIAPLERESVVGALTSISQTLLEWSATYRDSGSQRERGFQHLLGSKSRGAALAVFDYYSTIAAVILFIETDERYRAEEKPPLYDTGRWDWMVSMAPKLAGLAKTAPDKYHRSLLLRKVGQILSMWNNVQNGLCRLALGLLKELLDESGLKHLEDAVRKGLDPLTLEGCTNEYRASCPAPELLAWRQPQWDEVFRALVVFQRAEGYTHSEINSQDDWLKVTADAYVGQCATGRPGTPSLTVGMSHSRALLLAESARSSDVLIVTLRDEKRKDEQVKSEKIRRLCFPTSFGSVEVYHVK